MTTECQEVIDEPEPNELGAKGTADDPFSRWHFALVNYRNESLVLSGGYQNHTSAEIFIFNLATNTWTKRSAMFVPRSYHSACVLNTTVYFMCGRDSS
mmetsp:Transcript_47902/g.63380  ORF Transcript_47902/g.63380 Transcript_47902/m.63380 type:complete len:98 (+) Transcript_47902:685-978(+)